MLKKQPKIFIISGPSRSGKNCIIKALLRRRSLNLEKVITATSRSKRFGEKDGRDYYFLTVKKFQEKIKQSYFLEWAKLRGGQYFGAPKAELKRIADKKKNIIMTIDVQGARQVAEMRNDIVRIFIKPDSVQNIKKRMKIAGFSKDQMIIRLNDMKRELKEAENYDYIVVNREGKLNEAVEEAAGIIKSEISKGKTTSKKLNLN